MKHEHEADELRFVSRQTLGLMEPEVLLNVPQQSAGARGPVENPIAAVNDA